MSVDAKVNLLWLWPDILNLHGDRGNAMAFQRIGHLCGVEVEVTRVTQLSQGFDLEKADIVLLGSGEIVVLLRIIEALSGNPQLGSWIDDGGVLFAVGTTGSALGRVIHRRDGKIAGLGLLDMESHERKMILGDDLIYKTQDMTIYGSQVHMMDVHLGPSQSSFGSVTYGYGNNGGSDEGAVRQNLVYTNALGPVLVKNPWLVVDLINRALVRRGIAEEDRLVCDPALFRFELASAEAIQRFNDSKEKPQWARG
ncbi:MAG: hypothetical protein LBG99_02145 [Propionibacteriaceae bacterium]|jgi:CobQ-like glutamine amidotransferase family enzyme|nr:hypothetical protein [Propionibacteriaceae bacterium]